MKNILVVEDSKFFLNVIQHGFERDGTIKVHIATSVAETKERLARATEPFELALVDLRLPDGLNGEAADLALAEDIPTVVFTSNFNEDIRDRFLDRGVLDFILKDSPSSLDYLRRLVYRVIRNRDIKVLVVDDSTVARRVCADLLRKYRLNVVEAASGDEALVALKAHEDIKLIVTDHRMPDMTGFELVNEVRRHYGPNELAIIGVSASGGAPLSAKFLKYGANDFMAKPYLPEELYTRVAQNLDALEFVERLNEAATTDFLTGLYNRRTFFDVGEKMIAVARRAKRSVAVGIMDIDHFKKVNDTYGHDAGDDVLKTVAGIIAEHAGRGGDLCARLGGEEFALILEVEDETSARRYFEHLRATIEDCVIDFRDIKIACTASIGVVFGNDASLESMIGAADECLYRAKAEGRNRVCAD